MNTSEYHKLKELNVRRTDKVIKKSKTKLRVQTKSEKQEQRKSVDITVCCGGGINNTTEQKGGQ
jgi:hypothetical protein